MDLVLARALRALSPLSGPPPSPAAAWTTTAARAVFAFLLQSNVHTRLVEFREQGYLRMVSIIDELPDGISSVYTFFDPEKAKNSLGTYSILWQINEARRRHLPYVYLGYWIEESRKMSYKTVFNPIEGLMRGQWTRLPAAAQ